MYTNPELKNLDDSCCSGIYGATPSPMAFASNSSRSPPRPMIKKITSGHRRMTCTAASIKNLCPFTGYRLPTVPTTLMCPLRPKLSRSVASLSSDDFSSTGTPLPIAVQMQPIVGVAVTAPLIREPLVQVSLRHAGRRNHVVYNGIPNVCELIA